MLILVKKIFVSILTLLIIVSSTGITIINHICKKKNISLTGFSKVACKEVFTKETNSCCEKSNTCVLNHSKQRNSLDNGFISFLNSDSCCSNLEFSKKVNIISKENNLKKFSVEFQPNLKVEYIKDLISEYFNQKIKFFEEKVTTPIKRIIILIRIITSLFSSSDTVPLS